MTTKVATIDMKVEAKAFCEANGITSGWTQEQHIGLQFNTIADALGVEAKEDRAVLFSVLTQTCNPSAFRQRLESAGVLAKSDKTSAATALANKYVGL